MKIIRHKKKVNEEGEQTQQTTNTTDNNSNGNGAQEVSTQTQQKSVQVNTQIAELLNKKMMLRTQYHNDVKNIDSQIVQLQKQKAELGEDVDIDCIEEKWNPDLRFGRKLFEAVTNRTDEMFGAIKIAFESIDNLSVRPTDTRCRTFAKNIISYLNKVSWYGKDHTSDFSDYVRNMLNKSQVSLSNDEKKAFVDKLVGILKDNALFSWIFGLKNE